MSFIRGLLGLGVLNYLTCHLADAFILSDFQLVHSASLRGHSGFSILPKDTLAWAEIRVADLLVAMSAHVS